MTAPFTPINVTIEDIDDREVNRMIVEELHRLAAQLRFNLLSADDTDHESGDTNVELIVNGRPLTFSLYRLVHHADRMRAVLELAPIYKNVASGDLLFIALTSDLNFNAERGSQDEYEVLTWKAQPVAFEIRSREQTDPGSRLIDAFYSQSDGDLLKFFDL